MKNKKFFKISLLILSLALVIGMTFALTASANEPASGPEIVSQNINYKGDFALMYAVDAATVKGDSVTLYVYNSYPTDGVVSIWDGSDNTTEKITELDEGAGDYYVFQTPGIAAKDMAKCYYVQAVDAENNKGPVMRYSVAEYLYEKLTDDRNTEKQNNFLNIVIAFGDNAQIYIGGKADNADDLISKLRYVTVEGGKLDTYFDAGVYPIGSTLPLTNPDPAAATTKWNVTYTYAGGTTETLSNQSSVEVKDAVKTEVALGSSTAIAYPDGYRDLDEFVPGGQWNSSTNNSLGICSGGSAGKDYAIVDGHGTVLHATEINSSKHIYVTPTATGKAYDEATSTAFEISFDIKMLTSGDADDRIQVSTYDTGRKRYVDFYQYDSEGNLRSKLYVQNFHNAEESREFDVNPNDWFNVRMVVYKNDSDAVYVYINGDTENYLRITRSGSTVDFASLSRGNFYGNNITDGTADQCYVDNVFVGFTTETNPWSAQ